MNGLAAPLFAAVALVPAMAGTVESPARQLTLALCDGGSLSIAIPAQQAPAPGMEPCCVNKGCHSGNKRKRFDPAQ